MNGMKRAVIITAMATIGLVACGDDNDTPAPAVTNPAPTGTEAMVDSTEAMVDTTEVMVDSTEVMVDESTATTGG